MDKKNTIIEQYTVPKHSDDLADRIIMAAREIPQKQSPLDRFKTGLAAFQTPALSYSFASLVIVGILIGGVMYKAPQTNSINTDITLADILDEDDSLLIL